MSRLRALGMASAVLAIVGCGGDGEVRRQQPPASAPAAAPRTGAALVPPTAPPGGQVDATEVLTFAGLQLPGDARQVAAVILPGQLPSYRVTALGDRAVVDGICAQIGGTLVLAGDLTPGELRALGLSAQPPPRTPTCASSRRDYPRVQRQLVALPQDAALLITISVLEFPPR